MGRTAARIEPVAETFARLLHQEIGATQVLLFGSRVRGMPGPYSDYDFLVVSPRFKNVRPLRRPVGLRRFWREAGGTGPLDLFCLTPEEFDAARKRVSLVSAVLPDAVDLLDVPAASERADS